MNRKKISILVSIVLISIGLNSRTVHASNLYEAFNSSTQTTIGQAKDYILDKLTINKSPKDLIENEILRYSISSDDIAKIKASLTTSYPNIKIIEESQNNIKVELQNKDLEIMDKIKSEYNIKTIEKLSFNISSSSSDKKDFDAQFYVKKNNGYLKVAKMPTDGVTPIIDLTSMDPQILIDSYLDCSIETITGGKHNNETFRFANLAPNDYMLPSISSADSVTITYNLRDKDGTILESSKQHIDSNKETTKIDIDKVQYSLDSENATLYIKLNVQNSLNLLSVPALYLNGEFIDKNNYSLIKDSSDNYYDLTIKLNDTKTPWNLSLFLPDESLSINELSINSEFLLEFNNLISDLSQDKTISKISGSLPTTGKFSNIKINDISITPVENNFETILSENKKNITADYNYQSNSSSSHFNVIYKVNCKTDYNGPDVKVEDSSGKIVHSEDTLYTSQLKFPLKVSFNNSSEISNIKSTNTYENQEYDLNLTTDDSGALLIDASKNNTNIFYNTTLPNVITLKRNGKSFKLNLIVDDNPPKINLELKDKDSYTDFSKSYFDHDITPSINISDLNLDKKNSKIILRKIDGDSTVTLFETNLNSSEFLEKNGTRYSLKTPINEEGNYSLIVQAIDKANNATSPSEIVKNFYIDKTAPIANLNGLDKINKYNYTNQSVLTPEIIVSDSNQYYTNLIVEKDGREIINENSYFNDSKLNLEAEGSYTLKATAYDFSGNKSYIEKSFVIDRTKPAIKLNITNDQFVNKAFKPIISTLDPNDSVSEITLDGVPISESNISELSSNKTYELKVKAKDKADNASETTIKFTIDTVLPKISVGNLEDSFYYNKGINPTINFEDTNMNSVSMLLNGKTYDGQPIDGEGNYQLKLLAIDKANNSSERVFNFVIDKTAPSITINGIENNVTYTTALKPSISIDDSNSLYSLLLDGDTYSEDSIGKNGKHTLIVKTSDKAGNSVEKVVTFFINKDDSELKISGVENGKHYSNSVEPIIGAEKGSSVEITLDGKTYKGGKISEKGEHQLVLNFKDTYGNAYKESLKFYVDKNVLPESKSFPKNIMFFIIGLIALAPLSYGLTKNKKKKGI